MGGAHVGRVQGKVAFVTGAARGQGRAHAVRLASEGADIIAVDICRPVEQVPYPMGTEDELAETVAMVRATGQAVIATAVDVASRTPSGGSWPRESQNSGTWISWSPTPVSARSSHGIASLPGPGTR